MTKGTFTCEGCGQQFPNNLDTIVRTGPGMGVEGVELTFHSPECRIQFLKKNLSV